MVACVFPPIGGSGGTGSVPGPPTAVVSTVARATASGTIVASNANRRGLIVVNDSTGFLFLKMGAGGDSSDWTIRLPPRATWEAEDPAYTGPVTGAWNSVGSGFARITEIS